MFVVPRCYSYFLEILEEMFIVGVITYAVHLLDGIFENPECLLLFKHPIPWGAYCPKEVWNEVEWFL